MKFNSSVKFVHNQSLSLLINLANGTWTRMRSDLLMVLEDGLARGDSLDQIIAEQRGNDKAVLTKLIPKLVEVNILVDEDNFQSEAPSLGTCHLHGSVTLMVTLRCNLACRHCSVSSCPSSKLPHPSYSDLHYMAHELVSLRPNAIVITGGEPLIRKDIFDLLREIRCIYNGKIALQTNGTLITPQIAETLAQENLIDSVDMSLDGVDEASCTPIRGEGSFTRAIQGIKHLQKAGITNVTNSFVITAENKHLQYQFALLCQELGTTHMLRTFSPAGRGKENQDEFNVPFEESVKAAEPLFEKTYGKVDDATTQRWLSIKMLHGLKAKAQCSAGAATITVSPTGDVYPCAVLMDSQFHMGNLLTEPVPLQQMLSRQKNKTLVKSFDIDQRPYCQDCDVRYFCAGQCLGENYEYTGNHLAPCRDCARVKKDLGQLVWGPHHVPESASTAI